jgi:hypothetical protein
VRAVLSRDYSLAPSRMLSVLLEAEKQISCDPEGLREETSRWGAAAIVSFGSMDVSSRVDSSDRNGLSVFGAVEL